MRTAPPIPASRSARLAAGACVGLLTLFAILSYSAALQKSATFDEPYHTLASWVQLHLHDFRIDYEDPPLANYWASLLNPRDSFSVNTADPLWVAAPADPMNAPWELAVKTLYQTPGNDGIAMVNRARFMMLLFGVALGALTIVWSWKLRGALAGVIVAVLFALDPTFLAHASLMKTDVLMALLMAAVCFTLWRGGIRMTSKCAASMALLLPIALCTKFSAVLLAPIILALLAIRVLVPSVWEVLGMQCRTVAQKSLAAIALLIAWGLVSWGGIWAIYGFRFSPTPDGSISLNTQLHRSQLLYYRFQATHPHPRPLPFDPFAPAMQHLTELEARISRTESALAEARAAMQRHAPPAHMQNELQKDLSDAESHLSRGRSAANELNVQVRRQNSATQPLSPEFAQQLMIAASAAYESTLALETDEYLLRFAIDCAQLPDHYHDWPETAFLFALDHKLLPSAWLHGLFMHYACSRVRGTFLLGQVSDTGWWYYFPLAILFKTPVATIVAMVLAGIIALWLIRARVARRATADLFWPIACVAIPAGIYMLAAMTSSLNIGVRHAAPIIPLMYVATAVLFAAAAQRLPAAILPMLGILGILLACETLLAWPNYIAYFNFAVGGSKNGINLLGDSNLDWGQDLPEIAKWQAQHPDVPLALNYFGTADPHAYGIRFDPLTYWPPHPSLRKTHVMALSATLLQGIYGSNFIGYRELHPSDVLGGGTIYLYDERNAP